MPDWKREVAKSFEALKLSPYQEASIVEEMSQHLEDRYEELLAEGVEAGEAHRAVLGELSDQQALTAQLRKRRYQMPAHDTAPTGANSSGNWLGDIARDIRFAFRAMRSNLLFSSVVVVTLGVGIGANTTVFSVINDLLLHPLPVEHASQLAAVASEDSRKSEQSGWLLPVSYPNFKDLQEKNRTFEYLAAYTSPLPLTLFRGDNSERVFGEVVTANYFDMLGLKPSRGRFFLTGEDGPPGAHAIAVLSYSSWQERFGADPGILGRVLRINGAQLTVVGIAPEGFRGVNAVFGPDLWATVSMAEQILPAGMRNALRERGMAAFHIAGCLQESSRRTQAEADIRTIGAALASDYPDQNANRSFRVFPVSAALFGTKQSGMYFGGAILMAIVGLVLLIACSNVANLLMARAAGRKQEIAVRLAIGASRGRLLRQLLTESVMFGLLGGLLGLCIGYEGCRVLWSYAPPEVAVNLLQPKPDQTALAFTLILSALTGVLFGLIPALQSSRGEVAGTLQEEARTAGRSRRSITFGNALLAGQVSLSLVALITAALFLRSVQQSYEIDPGFQTKSLAVFMTNPGQAGLNRTGTEAFYREVRNRVATLPGVQSVSWSANLPFWGQLAQGVSIEGREQRDKADTVTAVQNTVDLNYFETMAIPLVEGRVFTDADRKESLPVVVVNETMARKYWPHQEAIGKTIRLAGDRTSRQIVGVVKTANYVTLGEPPQPCIYLPLKQNFSDAMVLYVRAAGDPSALLVPVQREARTLFPKVSLTDARTGAKMIDQVLWGQKIAMKMLGVFGLLGLSLASIGLYGVMAYGVNRRRREIGVRMALGAQASSVSRMVLTQGMKLVGIGIAVGILASLLIAQALTRFTAGFSAFDPLSFVGATLVLTAVALLACYLPAYRASRVDPIVALRGN